MKAKKVVLIALASVFGAMGSQAIAQEQTRYFSFVTNNGPSSEGADATAFGPHEFVIAVNNEKWINQIEKILEYRVRPGEPVHILGKVVRGRVPYNEEYAFHLDPDSIELFFSQTEQCDATAFEVEEHLELAGVPDSGFLHEGIWCPWSSRLVREIRYPYPSR